MFYSLVNLTKLFFLLEVLHLNKESEIKGKKTLSFKIGIGLLITSTLFWIIAVIVPFTTFSTSVKAALIGVILVLAEISFWVAALLVGKEFVKKYKSYLNPKNWRKNTDKRTEGE